LINARKPVSGDPLVTIVIPAHDLEDMTEQCISSIRDKTTHKDFAYEIVLVDNGSEKPLKRMGDIQIRLDENKPFGEAVTKGINAGSSKSPYILILNNDTAVIDGAWLGNLLTKLRGQGNVAAVGPKQLLPNGTIYHTEVGFNDERIPFHLWLGYAHDHQSVQREKGVLALNFGCVLIRREAFDKVEGFDKRFGLAGNYEDIDLCLRLRKAGYVLIYTPSAEILHFGGQTLAQDKKWNDVSVQTNLKKFVEKWKDEPGGLFGKGE
jgi:GT2 family glycosyltransferase